MTKYYSIVGIIVVAAVIVFAVVRTHTAHAPAPEQTTKQPIATVTYYCNEGKSITAAYYKGEKEPAAAPGEPPVPGGSVAITLSDGRMMTLAQTISADDGRYANSDESFVFWSKGSGALVLEDNEQKSYIGCIAIAPEPAGNTLPDVYANGSDGFSVRLPHGYTTDETYSYQEMGPGKNISGIKFTIPASVATGTNLASDSYISVEEIPATKNCAASLFLDQGTSQEMIDGDTTYSVASSTGAGAGNRYEETIYAMPGTNPCIAVRYFIHYGVIENYPVGMVRAFDKSALLAEFDAIRRTLLIVQ